MTSNRQGFSLIELMVAMTIGVILLALITRGYIAQQEAHTNERLVVDMQQNGRSALAFMLREIRMAGYAPCATDPTNANCTNVQTIRGLQTVRSDRLEFTFDLDGNGDDLGDNESITYRFASTDDPDLNGIANGGAAVLKREHKTNAGLEPLAFNIQAIAFAYAFDMEPDGALDTCGATGPVIWAFDSGNDGFLETHLDTNDKKDGLINELDAAGGKDLKSDCGLANYVSRDNIRAVQVWILARTQSPLRGVRPYAQTYTVGPHHISVTDSYKRAVFNGIAITRNLRNP